MVLQNQHTSAMLSVYHAQIRQKKYATLKITIKKYYRDKTGISRLFYVSIILKTAAPKRSLNIPRNGHARIEEKKKSIK